VASILDLRLTSVGTQGRGPGGLVPSEAVAEGSLAGIRYSDTLALWGQGELYLARQRQPETSRRPTQVLL